MEKKNNRGIIILMGVIIGVLLVLCVLFATDTITFNKKNNTTSNEDATTTKDTSDINQTSSDKITGEKIVGNYTFEECIDGEANADGIVSACWDYKLKIENINNNYVATLDINGYQTFQSLNLGIEENDGKFNFIFKQNNENYSSTYKEGDILFAMYYNSDKLYTSWQKLQPNADGNKQDNIYFERK